MLLEAGVSALPVVDEKRCLLDVYARSDITSLAKANAYSQLQWEDVTVGVPCVCVLVHCVLWVPWVAFPWACHACWGRSG